MPTQNKAENIPLGFIWRLDHKFVIQNLESCKQNLECSGSCGECHNYHNWGKYVKSKRVRVPFFRLGVDTVARMNICAFTMVKQKCKKKKFPFSHAEGWSVWNFNLIIVWLQYTVCYIVIHCSCVFIKVSDFQSRV